MWTGPVGIFGMSYGGYSSVMRLLRHPEVFAAACAQSPVTTWLQYDSIYTERYMRILEENKDGYDNGSAMKYVDNLKGRLMLYYGTADNNVHPTNSMQLRQRPGLNLIRRPTHHIVVLLRIFIDHVHPTPAARSWNWLNSTFFPIFGQLRRGILRTIEPCER